MQQPTAALGEAPEDSTKHKGDRLAGVSHPYRDYRHADLGRSPTDGPVADDTELIGAIGPRPHDYLVPSSGTTAELLAPAVEPDSSPPDSTSGRGGSQNLCCVCFSWLRWILEHQGQQPQHSRPTRRPSRWSSDSSR